MLVHYILFCLIFSKSSAQDGLTEEEIIEITNVQNQYRSQTNPGASGMPKLVYDTELSSRAQVWTDNCNFRVPPPEDLTYSDVGFTIMITEIKDGRMNFTAAVESWNAEGENYNIATNECSAISCSNYLQLVSDSAKRFGCGYKECDFGSGPAIPFLFCIYQDKPDLTARPFKVGSACTTCPEDFPTCAGNLCVFQPTTSSTSTTSKSTYSSQTMSTTCKPQLTTTHKYWFWPCSAGVKVKFQNILYVTLLILKVNIFC